MSRLQGLPHAPFGWYYLVRTAEKGRRIVANRSELHAFQKLLTAAIVRAGAHLHFAYADDKEVHLAVRAGQADINMELGRFFQRYSRAVNRVRRDKGLLFRPHGRRLLVQRGHWFLQVGRYIHWLPHLRPRTWEGRPLSWSTDAVYRNRRKTRGIVTSFTFRALSAKSPRVRVQDQAYATFFGQRPTVAEVERISRGSREDARILGDVTFVQEIHQRLGVRAPRHTPEWVQAQGEIQRATRELIGRVQAICEETLPPKKASAWKHLMTLDNICSPRRTPPLPMLRGVGASYVIAQRISTLRHAERFFHCRPGTLSAGRRLHYEQRFRELFGSRAEDLFQKP